MGLTARIWRFRINLFRDTRVYPGRSDGCSCERSSRGTSHRRLVGRGWRLPFGSVPSQRITRKAVLSLLHSFFLEDAFQAQPESCWQKGELPTLSSPSSSGSSPRDFKILPGTAKIFLNFCPVPAAVHWISSHPYTGIQGRGSFRSIIC